MARAGDAAAPISDSELPGLFDHALTAPCLALAVSGGADSMALLHLVGRWRALHRPHAGVLVLTVDHGLRPESGSEASFVASAARQLGFDHRTLIWTGPKPEAGLQAAAREARYALMRDAIRSEMRVPGRTSYVSMLVTAHHADDQAETLLMRLARGSGIDGLASMKPDTMRDGVRLVRPLLQVPKSRLLATLKAASLPWLDDPSNANDRFERVRWRQVMPMLNALGLTAEALSESAKRLASAVSALETAVDAFSVTSGVDRHQGAFATLNFAKFASGHGEFRTRLLRRLISENGGSAPPAQLSEIEDLAARIATGVTGAATLGGVIIRWSDRDNKLSICREPGRFAPPPLRLTPGQSAVWDQRFVVGLEAGAVSEQMCQSEPVCVRALGAADYATLRKELSRELPSEVAATLPAFILAGQPLAVPYFSDQSNALSGPLTGDGHRVCYAHPLTATL